MQRHNTVEAARKRYWMKTHGPLAANTRYDKDLFRGIVWNIFNVAAVVCRSERFRPLEVKR
jgi:hypothetical protein